APLLPVSMSALTGVQGAALTDIVVAGFKAQEQSLSFSLSGPDAALFQISDQGVISFITPPVFADPHDANLDNVYEITVSVSDGAGGHDSQKIYIAISGAN